MPFRDQTAISAARALTREWIFRYGLMESLHSDQGRCFEGHVIAELCRMFGVNKSRTTAYHPQGNAPAERFNSTLHKLLCVLEQKEKRRWPQFLPELCWMYNSTPHSTTGFSPWFLLFGREPRLPIDLILKTTEDDANDWIVSQQQRLAVAWDLASQRALQASSRRLLRAKKPSQLEELPPGRVILLPDRPKKRAKIQDFWNKTPFTILRQVGPYSYHVQRADGTGQIHSVRREHMLDRRDMVITGPEDGPTLPPGGM